MLSASFISINTLLLMEAAMKDKVDITGMT